MGLATPAAIMAGSNAAAQRGILIRDGVALEKAGRVGTVLFDKTGTLTTGRAEVVKVWDEGRLLNPEAAPGATNAGPAAAASARELATALAEHSSHPISQAVAKLSAARAPLDGWQEVRGSGVTATLAVDRGAPVAVRLGALRWLEESGVDLAPGKDFIAEWAAQGATVVGLAEADAWGFVCGGDALKPELREVVRGTGAAGVADLSRDVAITR